MPQIVIADAAQAAGLQQFGKGFGDVVGLNQFPRFVDTDIVQISGTVAAAPQTAVFLLLGPQRQQAPV